VALRHPPGLSTLFLTEMWERFSYYGNRSLLILYMTDHVHGGLGLDVPVATAIYGLFSAAVYLTALPGGWLADRFLGAQRTLVLGGVVILAGNLLLVVPETAAFAIALALIAVGSGLLKPNASAIVGQLYPEGGFRRDAGFTLFYVGINVGAVLGPLICSSLAEHTSWHWGFLPAACGMLAGLLQFRLTAHRLGEAGRHPNPPPPAAHGPGAGRRRGRRWLLGGGLALALLGTLAWVTLHGTLIALARVSASAISLLAVVVILGVLWAGRLDADERRRVLVIVLLMACSVLFWAGFEQAGSSLTLFAKDHTQTHLSSLDADIPVGWFQSINPLAILVLAPLGSALWMHLGRRGRNPALLRKVAASLALLAGGYLVMAGAALHCRTSGLLVSPGWLVATYLLFTLGEICISPIGLSAVATLAPRRFSSQMMGLWFLAAALGNLVAGLVASGMGGDALERMPTTFLVLALASLLIAGVLAAIAPAIARCLASPTVPAEAQPP
jgi:POT family proton-dependent oligopeptide transporter